MTIEFNIEESKQISGIFIFTPSIHLENRGAIWTSFKKEIFKPYLPKNISFIHDKFSISKENVLRGIHGDNKTWKLVSCIHGDILQVVVDFRKESNSYLQHQKFELSNNNNQIILIPPWIGNAFYVKSLSATYHYKLAYDGGYADVDEQFTIAWNDARLNIKWPSENPIISDRDKEVM